MIPRVEFVYSDTYDGVLFSLAGRKWNEKYMKSTARLIKLFEKNWRRIEKKVLSEMAMATGLRWREKKITCFIVNCGIPFSYPLTMQLAMGGRKMSNEQIIDILVHELIHILLFTNGVHKIGRLWSDFRDEPFNVKVHIYTYAVHEHLLLKFFGERRLKKEIEKAIWLDKTVQYGFSKAWEIVDEYGYENLLKEVRNAAKGR
jgi:hypothetical protein